MAILMKLDNEIDKTKYYTDEEKAEIKKANKGKIVCPIMSPEIIKWSGNYAVCVKELCALWDDDHCAFCKKAESEE